MPLTAVGGFLLSIGAALGAMVAVFQDGAGVLIDAFLIRMTLIPALMSLLGHRAWYLPRVLDRRIPNVDIEGAAIAHHTEPRAANPPALAQA